MLCEKLINSSCKQGYEPSDVPILLTLNDASAMMLLPSSTWMKNVVSLAIDAFPR